MSQKLKLLYYTLAGFSVVGTTGALAVLLRVLSLGKLTDFNRKYLVANSSRLVLRLMGIKLISPPLSEFPKDQVFYTFNHNSYLDTLIITALGLPNNRFLLSEKTLKIIPLTLSALGIGTLYIPLKKARQRRLQFFQKLQNRAQKEKFSVFGSSEGTHDFVHGIAPFNKGVYHFAMAGKLDIVPLFFHIPKESNPMTNFSFKKGTVRVEILPRVSTTSWQLDNLPEHVSQMRQLFVTKFNEAHQVQT
jgi:1-acyl-sn-glycerol-3-phosphate acyltransferase